MNPENHKGLWCNLAEAVCQEGYCAECEIYLRLTKNQQPSRPPEPQERAYTSFRLK